MRNLNFLLAGTDYKSDQKFRKFTTVFWTQCKLEWTTYTIRYFESLLLHFEPSAFLTLCWLASTTNTIRKLASSLPYSTLLAETDNSDPVVQIRIQNLLMAGTDELCSPEATFASFTSVFWTLCSLETTKIPIRKFTSLLPYSELRGRYNQPTRLQISRAHCRILNSVLAGMNYGYDQKCRKLTFTFRTLRSLEPFGILNSLLARTNYKYDQKVASSLPYSTMLAETDKSDPLVQMRILHFLIAGNAELCSLEPTTNPIRNFASSLPYFELSARCNERRIWSEILKVYFYIPNPPLAGTVSHSELSAG